MEALKEKEAFMEPQGKLSHKYCCRMLLVGRLKHIHQLERDNRAARNLNLQLSSLLIKLF
jgi:hypothetical protein